MKELDIYKLFSDCVIKSMGVGWKPAKVKFYQNDIFGIFDCVVIDNNARFSFYQLTTADHKSHRLKKMIEFFEQNLIDIPPQAYLALYYPVAKKFVIIQLSSGNEKTILI